VHQLDDGSTLNYQAGRLYFLDAELASQFAAKGIVLTEEEYAKCKILLDEKDAYWSDRIKQVNTEITEAYKKETAQWAPYKRLFSPLQLEAFQLASKLRDLLDKSGPRPVLERDLSLGNDSPVIAAYLSRVDALVNPWLNRLLHTYAADFAENVRQVIHRLAAEGVPVVGWAEKAGCVTKEDDILALAEQLPLMAIKLDYTPETRRLRHEA